MPAYLGIGKSSEAALWDQATHTDISDETMYDLRVAVSHLARRYRLLRGLTSAFDEENVSYSPDEIPELVKEIDELFKDKRLASMDISPSFEKELADFLILLKKASESGFFVVAHIEHHTHPDDIIAEKRRRLSRAAQ